MRMEGIRVSIRRRYKGVKKEGRKTKIRRRTMKTQITIAV